MKSVEVYHVLNIQWQEIWDNDSYLIWQKLWFLQYISNPSDSSISIVSKRFGILLLILLKLTLYWMLISFSAGTILVLGILYTKNLSWFVDRLMRLTNAFILFDLMFLTLLWSDLIRAFSYWCYWLILLWHWTLKLAYPVVL